MQDRLIEVIIPAEHKEKVQEILTGQSLKDWWYDKISSKKYLFKLLIKGEILESLSDIFQRHFSKVEGFKINVMTVEAVIPPETPDTEEKDEKDKQPIKSLRVSREELYADIINSSQLTWVFVAAVIISSVVASIGLLKDSVAIIIGAMVIAPLLGPNVYKLKPVDFQ